MLPTGGALQLIAGARSRLCCAAAAYLHKLPGGQAALQCPSELQDEVSPQALAAQHMQCVAAAPFAAVQGLSWILPEQTSTPARAARRGAGCAAGPQ